MIKKTFVKPVKESYNIYTNVKGSNGVIVCTLTCVCNYISSQINNNLSLKNKLVVSSTIPSIFTVKGVAVCNINDTFNESLGKKIALSKAKRAMFKSAYKYYEYYRNLFSIFNKELLQITDNINKAEGTEYNHLEIIKKQ